ncbi:hypothetical protein B0H16DRAFT_1264456, partial [Mycena metata]
TNLPPSDSEIRQILLLIREADEKVVHLNAEVSRAAAALNSLTERRDTRRKDAAAFRAIISPIRRIPTEILAQIFLASLADDAVASDNIASDSYTGQTVLLPPILFGHVSSGWRAVAAATPRLWSDIRLQIEKP